MLMISVLALSILAGPPGGVPPGQAKKGGHHGGSKHAEGVPPGLAKKPGGLPPGLAKKFGRRLPERPYIAFDPRNRDRAWFLIDGRWELKTGLSGRLDLEIQDALRLPLVPPPVPLPRVGVDLHVVLFN